MEAIDTVMSDQQLDGISVTKEEVNAVIESGCFDGTDKSIAVQEVTALTIVFNRKVAKAQAEISFKAGEDQGYKNGRISGYNEATQKGIKAMSEALVAGAKLGRKEVVKWIKSREVIPDVLGAVRFYASRKEWQAFLKKLGLLRQEMPK